jgi:hypothetical protein
LAGRLSLPVFVESARDIVMPLFSMSRIHLTEKCFSRPRSPEPRHGTSR